MKTLFFIAALAGAVYLILQTPAGKSWLEDNKTELLPSPPPQTINTNTSEKGLANTVNSNQVTQLIDSKINDFTKAFTLNQQDKIKHLTSRIAELENELIMKSVNEKQQTEPSSGVTLHPYTVQSKQPEKPHSNKAAMRQSAPVVDIAAHIQHTPNNNVNSQLQRNRQVRLQDIAEKMEMSSLQALVE